MSASPGTGTAGTVDKQRSADFEPGLARRFGFMSVVTFTLSMLALDVTADLRAAPWALNVVGWGLFLGLGALATSVGFYGTRRARLARWLFALSGVSMLVLLLGFVMSSTVVQLAGAFSGWFVTLPAAGIVTALIFLDGPARSKSVA